VFVTSSFANTPILSLLRSIANWVLPSAALQSTRLDLAVDSTRTAMIILLLQMALFQVHLLRRVYESLCVSNFSERSTQHGLITLIGQISRPDNSGFAAMHQLLNVILS
jgi:hypothetical protein